MSENNHMDESKIQELSEVIQSSHLNFLLGAGVSRPFLPLLNKIEEKLNKSESQEEKEKYYKEYLKEVMLPNKKVVENEFDSDEKEKYAKTREAYESFFKVLTNLILKRKSTILSKQVNLFSTNVDILMETVFEELQIEYNDGFYGRFKPVFGLENFKKSVHQRSIHFDHISKIPVYNIIKIHGSLTWAEEKTTDSIVFSGSLDHFDENLKSKTGQDFLDEYKKILVVNPEETKHLKSVLNLYYSELLRMYSSELERESAVLFVLGFSMRDRHIKQITLRAAKSNPTLRVFICCAKKESDEMKKRLIIDKHANIELWDC